MSMTSERTPIARKAVSLTGAEHAQDPGATGEHQHRHTVSETEMGFPLIALCLIFREK
jgi:hypothetical protein